MCWIHIKTNSKSGSQYNQKNIIDQKPYDYLGLTCTIRATELTLWFLQDAWKFLPFIKRILHAIVTTLTYVEFQPIISVGVVNFSEEKKIVVDFSIQSNIQIISRPKTYIVILSSSRWSQVCLTESLEVLYEIGISHL